MPLTLKLATSNVAQAVIVPDATAHNDGMMTPTQLRMLKALWDDTPGLFVRSYPIAVTFNSGVALAQSVVIPDATPLSAGVITKQMVQQLNALWLASGKTLPPAPPSIPVTLRFDVNLTCPQEIILSAVSERGTSGAMTGTMVQQLTTLVNNPPAAGWTQNLIAAGASVSKVWGFSANEVYSSDRQNVWKWDGAAWTNKLTGVNQINSLWGPGTGVIYAVGGIHIRRSIDGGATWQDRPTPVGFGGGQAIWGADANNLFLTGSTPGHASGIYASTDAGATWARIADDPDGDALQGIWGFAANDVYFSGGGDEVRHWDGAALSTIAPATFNESSFAIWGAVSGNVYWVTDIPTLPRKQVNHAVGLTLFAENGPWITNGGGAPDDEVWGISGKDATHIYAVGFNNNGAKAYKISVPSDVAPGTWVLDALPSGADTDAGAQALQVWVDPVSGFVMAVGQRSNGDGVSWSK